MTKELDVTDGGVKAAIGGIESKGCTVNAGGGNVLVTKGDHSMSFTYETGTTSTG